MKTHVEKSRKQGMTSNLTGVEKERADFYFKMMIKLGYTVKQLHAMVEQFKKEARNAGQSYEKMSYKDKEEALLWFKGPYETIKWKKEKRKINFKKRKK